MNQLEDQVLAGAGEGEGAGGGAALAAIDDRLVVRLVHALPVVLDCLLVAAADVEGDDLLGEQVRVVGALVQDLVQARYNLQLFVIAQVQEAVLPDELEDCSWIGDQEVVLRVLLEDQAKALLLAVSARATLVVLSRIALHRLLDLRLVEEHQVLNLGLQLLLGASLGFLPGHSTCVDFNRQRDLGSLGYAG